MEVLRDWGGALQAYLEVEQPSLTDCSIIRCTKAFFVDFASKHALHANVKEVVRYSGEFHWRPRIDGGWAGFSEDTNDDAIEWELVIDNNSGTYSPDKAMLPKLKEFMEFNFPGLHVVVHDHGDSDLKQSEAILHQYAKDRRGIQETEFTAHPKMGETTLINMAARLAEKLHIKKVEDDNSDDDFAKRYQRIKLGEVPNENNVAPAHDKAEPAQSQPIPNAS